VAIDVLWPYAVAVLTLVFVTPLYRWYLRRHLLFPVWKNLSSDQRLNVGESLSELFYSELYSLRQIHQHAAESRDIWNARSNAPILETSSDGHPWFISQARFIAGNTPALKLISIMSALGRPSQVRGSIHMFGEVLYLQLRIDGPMRSKSPHLMTKVFAGAHPIAQLDELPDIVRLLAYQVYMELTGITEFSTPQAFRDYTHALERV
jgi:hypothetical protein